MTGLVSLNTPMTALYSALCSALWSTPAYTVRVQEPLHNGVCRHSSVIETDRTGTFLVEISLIRCMECRQKG